MGLEFGNDFALIRDGNGTVALVVGRVAAFPTSGIPSNALGYDPVTATLYQFSSGSWTAATLTASALTAAITGAVTGNVTGDLTGNVTGNVNGDVTGNLTGSVELASIDTYKQNATAGNAGHIITGVIEEELTLSTVATTTDFAATIPANSRVVAVFARVTEVIDTATAVEIGITGTDTDGYVPSMAVAAGTTSVAQGALVGLANPRAGATTVTALVNAQNSATGKIRLAIIYETLVAPTS